MEIPWSKNLVNMTMKNLFEKYYYVRVLTLTSISIVIGVIWYSLPLGINYTLIQKISIVILFVIGIDAMNLAAQYYKLKNSSTK
jgi:hypothetical protein